VSAIWATLTCPQEQWEKTGQSNVFIKVPQTPNAAVLFVLTLESECKGNYSATSNDMKLVHWPLMGGLLHFVQGGGDWAGPQPAQAPPRCTKCNSPPINGQCTNHRIAV